MINKEQKIKELSEKIDKLTHTIQFGKKSEVDKPKLKEERNKIRIELQQLKTK